MALPAEYWSATKPVGMPDEVWKEQQAKKKAEEDKKNAIIQEIITDFDKRRVEEALKKADIVSKNTKNTEGSVITGGIPLAGSFSAIMNEAANKAVESGGKEDPITDAFVETLLGSEKMQENYKNTEEGYVKDKVDAGLEKYTQKESISQETLNQVNSIIQSNMPTVDPYVPTDYVSGTYTPLSTPSNPTLNTTSDEVAKYALAIMQAAKGELGDVVKPEYMQADKPNAPELRTLEELANAYGITYDYDKLYGLFNDSVEKQYEAIYAKQRQNEDAYYDNAAAAQNTLLDTLSRDRSNAVQAGVSKGMQAANALGAMLGVSQQFANNATTLSQERSNTAKDYGADLAQAMVDAEATSNERKNAIMEIAKMLYGYDSEQYVANMDNYNTILTNNAGLQQTYLNNQAALQNALASIFNNSASSKITGDANIQSSQIAAEANRLAAQYAAEAQRYAAYQTAEANKQAAVSAAQGNVDAYKEYANALIAQAAIGSGRTNSYTNPLTGEQVPLIDPYAASEIPPGDEEETEKVMVTTPGVAEQFYVDPKTGQKKKVIGLTSSELYNPITPNNNIRTN